MASRSLGSLTVDLIAKIAGFRTGMDQAARLAEDRSRRIERTMQRTGRAITAAFAAIGGGALVRQIIRASVEQEDALRQLEQRIKSTGGVAGRTSEQLTNMAKSLQSVTTFSDEAIVQMQGLLLTFTNVRGDIFDSATESILNLSVALGTDLRSAALQVGKALNDPILGITALQRAGVQLSNQQKDQIRRFVAVGDIARAQGIILEELQTQFGGAARAAADTLGGALAQLKNAFGDLFEVSGPSITGATGAIRELTALLQSDEMVRNAAALGEGIVRAFASATQAISDTIGTMRFLGEELAAVLHGVAADDIPRLEDALEQALRARASGPLSGERIRVFGPGGLVEYWSNAELDAEIEKIRTAIEQARTRFRPLVPAPTETTGIAPGVAVLPPSEEFLKLEAQLQQQIALFGEVGQAARLAYQIQVSALDELSTAEQERVLALARQLDALVENAEKTKEIEVERQRVAKEREQAEAQLLARGEALYRATLTPAEQYAETLGEINDLLNQGAIEHETYARAVKQAQDVFEAAEEAAKETSNVIGETLGRGVFDTVTDYFMGIETSFKEMLRRLAIQAATSQLFRVLAGLGGPTGTAFTFLGFGGSRHTGGDVDAGTIYNVRAGETYFAPTADGQIVPREGLGGITQNLSVHFDVGLESVDERISGAVGPVAQAAQVGVMKALGRPSMA